MAFGKNKKQNEEAIHPNNYCGGFAMCAILNDMAGSESNAPMDIYNEIQTQHQQQLPASLARLVENMGAAGNNTSICLPSSLVLFAQSKGLVAEIKYSENINFTYDEIEAEKMRCSVTEGLADEKAVLDCFCSKDVAYVLMLVNSCHWIAVKRKSLNKGFSVYDPGTGNSEKCVDKTALIEFLKREYRNVGELIILLNQQ